jgi:glucosamine-6-phosphate deaminase
MRTNLSSQISLNRVSTKYYKPENAVERSVLTRFEKVPTDIYETVDEGVYHIANEIAGRIRDRQREGKFFVIGAGTGTSLRPLYAELVRKHKDEGLSFRNVVVFNLYEYYPLTSESIGSSFAQLTELFVGQVDIDKQNVFTIDGSIPQEAVFEYCRLYEQRILTFGGLDIALMGSVAKEILR